MDTRAVCLVASWKFLLDLLHSCNIDMIDLVFSFSSLVLLYWTVKWISRENTVSHVVT